MQNLKPFRATKVVRLSASRSSDKISSPFGKSVCGRMRPRYSEFGHELTMLMAKVEEKSKMSCAVMKAPEGWRSPRRFAQAGTLIIHLGNLTKGGTTLAGEGGGKIYSVGKWPLN